MTPFHVGMKVVCISDQWEDRSFFYKTPTQGQVYTIEHIENSETSSGICFLLYELTNAPVTGLCFGKEVFQEPGFDSGGFRPLVSTNISIFEKMLTKKPRKKAVPKKVTA